MNPTNLALNIKNLPILDVVEDIQNHFNSSNTLIVNAPPGAGKSTYLPLSFLNQHWLNSNKKIILLEPRRLAAKSIASRMAEILGEQLGETIGYRIRFESKIGSNTKVEVVTEGILTRMLLQDNALEDVALVIFDEFHERSIHADLALALCKESQTLLRDDLKILVMSATLNMPSLQKYLGCKAIVSQGRQHPVDIVYGNGTDIRMAAELVAQTIIHAVQNHQSGDVLAFLPGQGEIKKCETILRQQLKGFFIHPLYGMLTFSKQQSAILPRKDGKRKIVLATSIAETSLTIEGVTIVVDSGLSRKQVFDPNSGLSKLETIPIDQDSATQRAGRAGRLQPGTCYRLWSLSAHQKLQQHREPEILNIDLASVMLTLAQWGIESSDEIDWLDNPPQGHVEQASALLNDLAALKNNKITSQGKAMLQLPCHPRIAHMLLEAKKEGSLALATDIAAILEERDPLATTDSGIDLNLRIEALRRFRKLKSPGGPWGKIEKIAQLYRNIFKIEAENNFVDPFETGRILVYAYPERISHATPGNNAQFKLANGKIAMAGHKDDLAHEPWLAIANLNARDGLGKIFLAAPLNPVDLKNMVTSKQNISWNSKEKEITMQHETRIGNILLGIRPIQNPDKTLLEKALLEAVKQDGLQLLNFSKELGQWQNRVFSISKWYPEENWPNVETRYLLEFPESWLTPYLVNIKKAHELKKLDLIEILTNQWSYQDQKKLDLLAPTFFQAPSGSKLPIEYNSSGLAPVLKVKIQEMFGTVTNPTVNNGKVTLLIHLLSPGFKPVQITSDLVNFWSQTYFDVKKDLKGRYPKHYWPENPLEAEPTGKTKPRK